MKSDTAVSLMSPVELLKQRSPMLAGTISTTLADRDVDHFGEADTHFLKFHGVYQYDDRDLRKSGKQYYLLVRVRMPGGVLSPVQYLELDRLAGQFGNGTLRLTSRQTIQFHGVLKNNLAATIKGVNDALLTTLAAAGDVVRNITAPPVPAGDPVMKSVLKSVHELSKSLTPGTPAYHQIWLEGKKLDLAEKDEQTYADSFYGRAYLPRKFKIGFAVPPVNDVDVFTNCVGLIAIVENGRLVGYNLAAGGGMGRSHGLAETFPRLADLVGFITPEQVEAVVTASVTIHRDFGSRTNRKHARLKYVVADHGVDWFRAELEKRVGFQLEAVRPFEFTSQGDRLGWYQQADGMWSFGLFVENGRIKDEPGRQLRTVLRKAVERFQPEMILTPGNNLLLANLQGTQREPLTLLLAEHGVKVEGQGSPVRCASVACVALPTCGLAMAEAERYLPGLLTAIENLLAEVGLVKEEIVIRMSGCPNGCVRPYVAEIGFVGRAPGKYQIYLGGNQAGTRLARLYKDTVKDTDIIEELRPLLARFAGERIAGERFGDWVAGIPWKEGC